MSTESEKPDAPVFVDNSGARRRTWRRLGMAMGVAGGGYALAVAVSVIGGNSDAPWVLIPDGGAGKSDSVRVVPRPADDTDGRIPAAKAEAGADGQPSASASASSTNEAERTASSAGSPSPRESAGARTKAAPPGDRGGNDARGSGGGQGNAPSAPAEPTQGGTSSPSPGGSAGQDPEPTPGPSESGLLDGVLDQLGGVFAAGAE
jgi:hypothetical protein